jgi:hypothetical protein
VRDVVATAGHTIRVKNPAAVVVSGLVVEGGLVMSIELVVEGGLDMPIELVVEGGLVMPSGLLWRAGLPALGCEAAPVRQNAEYQT